MSFQYYSATMGLCYAYPQQPYKLDSAKHSNRSSKRSTRKSSCDSQQSLRFKTEVCKYWSNEVECPFGEDCKFAHGNIEVRNKEFLPTKYKTKICNKFKQEGCCPYGNRCQFIHNATVKRLPYCQKMQTLAQNASIFFYFQLTCEENGKWKRLPFFNDLTLKAIQFGIIEEEIEEDECLNWVENRSRHHSF